MSEVDAAATAPQAPGDLAGPPVSRPVPPARRGPGLRPALVVLGIAAFIVIVFSVAAGLWTGDRGTPRSGSATAPRKVAGTSLLAVPAGQALHAILQPGSPPSNIVDALAVPRGSWPVGSDNLSGNRAQFDAQVDLRVRASESSVIAFYRRVVRAMGWQVASEGPATRQPGYQVLAKKAGDDGWYWEVGVIVSPTVFGPSGVEATTGTTPFVIRLLQVPDLQ